MTAAWNLFVNCLPLFSSKQCIIKTTETIKPLAQDSGRFQVVVVYEIGFNFKVSTGNVLVFLLLGRFQEIVAYGGLTVLYM